MATPWEEYQSRLLRSAFQNVNPFNAPVPAPPPPQPQLNPGISSLLASMPPPVQGPPVPPPVAQQQAAASQGREKIIAQIAPVFPDMPIDRIHELTDQQLAGLYRIAQQQGFKALPEPALPRTSDQGPAQFYGQVAPITGETPESPPAGAPVADATAMTPQQMGALGTMLPPEVQQQVTNVPAPPAPMEAVTGTDAVRAQEAQKAWLEPMTPEARAMYEQYQADLNEVTEEERAAAEAKQQREEEAQASLYRAEQALQASFRSNDPEVMAQAQAEYDAAKAEFDEVNAESPSLMGAVGNVGATLDQYTRGIVVDQVGDDMHAVANGENQGVDLTRVYSSLITPSSWVPGNDQQVHYDAWAKDPANQEIINAAYENGWGTIPVDVDGDGVADLEIPEFTGGRAVWEAYAATLSPSQRLLYDIAYDWTVPASLLSGGMYTAGKKSGQNLLTEVATQEGGLTRLTAGQGLRAAASGAMMAPEAIINKPFDLVAQSLFGPLKKTGPGSLSPQAQLDTAEEAAEDIINTSRLLPDMPEGYTPPTPPPSSAPPPPAPPPTPPSGITLPDHPDGRAFTADEFTEYRRIITENLEAGRPIDEAIDDAYLRITTPPAGTAPVPTAATPESPPVATKGDPLADLMGEAPAPVVVTPPVRPPEPPAPVRPEVEVPEPTAVAAPPSAVEPVRQAPYIRTEAERAADLQSGEVTVLKPMFANRRVIDRISTRLDTLPDDVRTRVQQQISESNAGFNARHEAIEQTKFEKPMVTYPSGQLWRKVGDQSLVAQEGSIRQVEIFRDIARETPPPGEVVLKKGVNYSSDNGPAQIIERIIYGTDAQMDEAVAAANRIFRPRNEQWTADLLAKAQELRGRWAATNTPIEQAAPSPPVSAVAPTVPAQVTPESFEQIRLAWNQAHNNSERAWRLVNKGWNTPQEAALREEWERLSKITVGLEEQMDEADRILRSAETGPVIPESEIPQVAPESGVTEGHLHDLDEGRFLRPEPMTGPYTDREIVTLLHDYDNDLRLLRSYREGTMNSASRLRLEQELDHRRSIFHVDPPRSEPVIDAFLREGTLPPGHRTPDQKAADAARYQKGIDKYTEALRKRDDRLDFAAPEQSALPETEPITPTPRPRKAPKITELAQRDQSVILQSDAGDMLRVDRNGDIYNIDDKIVGDATTFDKAKKIARQMLGSGQPLGIDSLTNLRNTIVQNFDDQLQQKVGRYAARTDPADVITPTGHTELDWHVQQGHLGQNAAEMLAAPVTPTKEVRELLGVGKDDTIPLLDFIRAIDSIEPDFEKANYQGLMILRESGAFPELDESVRTSVNKAIQAWSGANQFFREGAMFNLVSGPAAASRDQLGNSFWVGSILGDMTAAARSMGQYGRSLWTAARPGRALDMKVIEARNVSPFRATDTAPFSGWRETWSRSAITGGREPILQRSVGDHKNFKRAAAIFASKTVRQLRMAADVGTRTITGSRMFTRHVAEQQGEWLLYVNKRLRDAGMSEDYIKSVMDHLRRTGETIDGVQHFRPQDAAKVFKAHGVEAGLAEHLQRRWRQSLTIAKKEAISDVNRALFSYKFTNADEFVSKFLIFHYWQSRAIANTVRLTKDNPWLLRVGYEMQQFFNEYSEDESLPFYVRGLFRFLGDGGTYMWFVDLPNIAIPYATFREQAMMNGEERNFDAILDQVGLSPWFTAALSSLGLSQGYAAPDPTGTTAPRSAFTAVADLVRNYVLPEHFDSTEYMGFTAGDDPLANLERKIINTLSEYSEGRIPFAQATEYPPLDASRIRRAREIIVDLYLRDHEMTAADLTEEDYAAIAVSMASMEADTPDALAQEAMATESQHQAIKRVVNSVSPISTLTQYGPQVVRKGEAEANREADYEGTPQEQAASRLQGLAIAEDPVSTQQIEGSYAIGTPEQQETYSLYQTALNGSGDELRQHLNGKQGDSFSLGFTTVSYSDWDAMEYEEREELLNKWLIHYDFKDQFNEYRDLRDEYLAENPALKELRDWQDQYSGLNDGDIVRTRDQMMEANGAYADYINDLPEERKTEFNGILGPDAYTAWQGEAETIYDIGSDEDGGNTDLILSAIEEGGGGGGFEGGPSFEGMTPQQRIEALNEDIAEFQQEYADFDQEVRAMTGGRGYADLSQASLFGLQDRLPDPPRGSEVLRSYMDWMEKQGGGDTSVEAYVAWYTQMEEQEAA